MRQPFCVQGWSDDIWCKYALFHSKLKTENGRNNLNLTFRVDLAEKVKKSDPTLETDILSSKDYLLSLYSVGVKSLHY